MLTLDHLAVACTSLDEGVAWLEDRLGVHMQPGGQHARYGTHNKLLGLADGLYLEVIAKDPGAVPEAGHSWFDLDHFTGPPRLANWICRTGDIGAALAIAPSEAGTPRALQRGDLSWQITVPDDGSLPYAGAFPTLIQWAADTHHPADRLPDSGCRLTRLEVAHPKADALQDMMALQDDRVQLTPGPFAMEATFENTPRNMHPMIIRPATSDDATQIAAIWNHAIRETVITFNPVEKPDEEVAALTAQDCLVWEAGGRILGFARYFPFRGGAGYRFTVEHTIMLHADGHGQGGGRALMLALMDHAKAAGKHSMFAGCSAENTGAVQFHARLGFEVVATLPQVGFKFGRWIDLVLMQKLF